MRQRRLSEPTLRRTWMTAVVRVVALLFVLALVVVTATEVQRQMFARTTAAVTAEMGLAITLKNTHLDLNEAAGPVIYRYGGAAEAPAAQAAYELAKAPMADAP